MSFEIKTNHKQAFKEIFKLIAKDSDTINRDGLKELFKTIGYQTDQFDEMADKIFKHKDSRINFDEFMKIFNLKMNDYSFNDVCNAFKLLAKDDDQYIPLEKVRNILSKNGLEESEINFLVQQLEQFTDSQKRVNYKQFLESLSTI
ncbi:hypothetical protein PPERSA_10336 [Pseudocohnilembus persalinus]|uniref:EF-hand domain-containing protein n=1 Tax=Pseudocohnilembus persalinus TaxID=266149 RepID=A0A0V0R094_PSEPJ|nr:hypothetical protein PPERSA_10336 [Pseudocohnilembus persalinus]|eukprot:KRX07948.1 hypothetical protein PPERSA_10336 [Pseudocohnilembus persalinus]